MKRLLLSLLLLSALITPVAARKMLRWDAPLTTMDANKIIPHAKSISSNYAVICVHIQPRIVQDFELVECSGTLGRDDKELKKTDIDNDCIYFYFKFADNRDKISSLQFRAKGYEGIVSRDCYIKMGDRFETTMYAEQQDYVLLRLQTQPAQCDVYVYDEYLGTSNASGFFEKEVLQQWSIPIKVEKAGYESEEITPVIKTARQNGQLDTTEMILTLPPITLLLKGSVGKGTLKASAPSDVHISLRKDGEQEYTEVAYGGNYKQDLDEGLYHLRGEKAGCTTFNTDVQIERGKTTEIQVPLLSPISGILDGQNIGSTPFRQPVSVGQHTLSLQKRNYLPSSTINVNIPEKQTVERTISLYKTENLWWSGSQYYPHHYMEAYYGMGFLSGGGINHYIGANYTYIRHALGFNLSMMYGFNNGDIVATVGPALTLTTQSKTDLDLQLLLGGGYASILDNYGDRHGTWVAEAGLRFGFENYVTEYNFSWWSLFLGAKYYDQKVVPTIGISLMPVGLLALGADYFSDDTDHAGYFFEPMMGYACVSSDWLVGGTFAWQTYNLGLYTSFMYGVVEGSIAAVAGPAIHLTPETDRFDLSLYGGIGYGRLGGNMGGDRHHVAGDLGLRFGFSSTDFSWWDFSLGCMTFGGEWVPNIGVSWGITGFAAAVAGSAVLAIWAGGGI